MYKADPAKLKKVIEMQHGGTAAFAQSAPIAETFDSQTVWEGVVNIFEVTEHPETIRCYA
jgi:hypothetical protein